MEGHLHHMRWLSIVCLYQTNRFFFKRRMIVMLQRTATMNVPLLVTTKNQYNSHQTLFVRRCCMLSDTPSCISSLIELLLVLSLLGFLLSSYFLFVFDLMQSIPNKCQQKYVTIFVPETAQEKVVWENNEITYVNSYKWNHKI